MSFNGKYVKIDRILNDISKYPFVEELTKREAAHHLISLLGLIGAVTPLTRTYKNIAITQHKGVLPSNIMYIHGVNNKGNSCDNTGIAMKYSGDIYQSSLHSDEAKKSCNGTAITTTAQAEQLYKQVGGPGEIIAPLYTNIDVNDYYNENSYTINGMSIDTSFPSGWVEIAYDAVQVDEEGFPMIPDDAAFKEAYKYFLLKQTAEPAYFRGTVQRGVYQAIEQKYYAYAGAAFNSLTMLSPDQYESMSNTLMRIVPDQHQYKTGWKDSNRPKY